MVMLADIVPPVGRDANDTTWLVFRYRGDWRPIGSGAPAPALDGLYFDPIAEEVELATLPPGPNAARDWLPLTPAVDADGNEYKSDPGSDRVLRKRACESKFAPLDCFGGSGWEMGRLRGPLGIAVDRRGWLYVADTGNHRVQVVRPEDGSVVALLGRTDQWGRAVAGARDGALDSPVDVAVDVCACRVYVADYGTGLVQVFDARFRWLRSFAVAPAGGWPPGRSAQLIGIAVADDGTLLVADAGWPRLLRLDGEGRVLAEIPPGESHHPHFAGLASTLRYPLWGEAIIGPLDSHRYDAHWHQVAVAATLPPGTAVEVQTFAANDSTTRVSSIPWAPEQPVTIPQAGERADDDGEYRRLVLSDTQRWARATHGLYRRRPRLLVSFPFMTADDRLVAEVRPGGASLPLPNAAVRSLRVGDTVHLDSAVPADLTVASLPAATVELFADGRDPEDKQAPFGPNTTATLLERDGVPMLGGPRVIYTLGASESIDLRHVALDGTYSDVPLLHALVALLEPDDLLALADAATGQRLELRISSIEFAASDVTFTTPFPPLPPGMLQYPRPRALYLTQAPGRLLVAELPGYELPLPLDEPITLASDGPATGTAKIVLADAASGQIWIDALPPGITWDNWTAFNAAPAAATDRGQYLWIRLRLRSALRHPTDLHGFATPVVHGLRMLYDRPSLLRYLPATFSRRDDRADPSGALFLERFLTLFEGQLTDVERRYDDFARQLDADAAAPEWLTWLASWLDIVFDPSWPLERRRLLVNEAMWLYHRRGTAAGLLRYLEIYTGKRPALLEEFRLRPAPGMVLGANAILGCRQLTNQCELDAVCATDYADLFAHRFKLYVYVDDACQLEPTRAVVLSIVEANKPAHTELDLQMVLPYARIGVQSTIDIDFVLGDGSVPPAVLGPLQEPDGTVRRPILGRNLRLGGAAPRAPESVTLEPPGRRIGEGFTLK